MCDSCDDSCLTCVSAEYNKCTSCKGTTLFTPNNVCPLDESGNSTDPSCK